MDKFYIITNHRKDKEFRTTNYVISLLKARGKSCEIYNGTAGIRKDMDCAIVLGGDGTLIRAARDLVGTDIPLLGVNLGTLGYLTEVEIQNIEEAIDALVHQKPDMEKRMMLKGRLSTGTEDFALNDIVLTRNGSLRIIKFNIYVNGQLLNTYQADGMIVSTPTGSTGYNLSAGGPLVKPEASMIVITPICAHALNTRSIILSAEDEIVIQLLEGRDVKEEHAGITFDGTEMIEMKTGDTITIRKAEEKTTFVKLNKVSFLETLRRKMKGN